MIRLSDLNVGIFTAAAIAAAVYFSMATTDNPFEDKGYVLNARLVSAEGSNEGPAVEMAGDRIGAINSIRIEGGRAVAELGMDPGFTLPIDSSLMVASRGILGDTVMKISSGTADNVLGNGDWIEVVNPPPSIAELQAQLGDVAQDVQAITGSLRSLIDSDETRGSVQAILANIEGFTEDLGGITQRNRGDLDAIVENIRVLTEQLGYIVEETRPELAAEMQSIQQATSTLNRSLERIESIASKIDEGEGTLGRLLNDDRLIDEVEGVVEDVGSLVGEVSRFQIDVYYRAEMQFTHDGSPQVGFGGKNVVGLRVRPRPDYWYVIEVVDDPAGVFSEKTIFQETESGLETVREITRSDNYQFTFQFAKRFRDLVLRLGVKENGGGIGADLMLAKDRVKIGLDLYDFTYASYPEGGGAPNLKFSVDVEPIKHVYISFGADNIINGAMNEQFTWYIGGGGWFTDNDLKWIAGSMPSGML